MTAQLALDGSEQLDPRTERVARALFDRDHGRSFPFIAPEHRVAARDSVWPRVRSEYVATARAAIGAYEA